MSTDSGQLPVAGGRLAEIEREIAALIGVGYRASQRIAVLVAGAKDRHFDTVPEWLEWCASRFGFAKRTAFQLAKVGLFLGHACASSDIARQDVMESASLMHSDAFATRDPLLSCDIQRLEYLANLYEEKPDQCLALVKAWNPAEHTREEVRDKVRSFLGEETTTATCQDCREEFETEDRKAKLCPACEKRRAAKAEKEKERRAAGAFERHLTALAELFNRNEAIAVHVPDTAPAMAFNAALVAADLAVTHVAQYHDVTRPELERWLGYVDTLQDTLRNLVAEADR